LIISSLLEREQPAPVPPARRSNALGLGQQHDVHAPVARAVGGRVVGGHGLGVGLAVGAHARGVDQRGERALHRIGARGREVPVRRIAQRPDRLVVGVPGDEHIALHLGQRLPDAAQHRQRRGHRLGAAGAEERIAAQAHHAAVGLVGHGDEALLDLGF
jgi:hypothetical protein